MHTVAADLGTDQDTGSSGMGENLHPIPCIPPTFNTEESVFAWSIIHRPEDKVACIHDTSILRCMADPIHIHLLGTAVWLLRRLTGCQVLPCQLLVPVALVNTRA